MSGKRTRGNSQSRGLNRGASIIEVLLAVAIFGALAASVLVFVWEPMTGSGSASERERAVLLAEEGLDAARSVRNSAWTDISDGAHGPSKSGGRWPEIGDGARQLGVDEIG